MKKCLMVFSVLVFSLSARAQYCIAGTSNCDEYIGNVTVAGINNSSVCGLIGGYSDYTAISGSMTAGISYTIAVTNPVPYSGDHVYVWIDWNGNGIFGDLANETFVLTTSNNSNFSAQILCPAGITNGAKRMRVRVSYGVSPGNPCGPENFGEVEDYTINVTNSGLAPVITVLSSPDCFNQSSPVVSASITDNAASGISAARLWYRKNSGAWLNMPPTTITGNTFSFQIDHTLAGGVLPGDKIQWYLAAINNNGIITTLPAGGGGNAGGNPGSTPPATFNYYIIKVLFASSYTENFEGARQIWEFGGSQSSWRVGVPYSALGPAAASPPNALCMQDPATSTINLNEHSWAIALPPFDFSGLLQDPFIEFDHKYSFEPDYDGGWIEYSINNGVSWQVLGTAAPDATSPTNWYTVPQVAASGGIPCWSGASLLNDPWIHSAHQLTGMAGKTCVLLRFRGSEDGSGLYSGWAIDNIMIRASGVPVVTANPVSQTACAGSLISFSATANGATGMKWQQSTDNGLTWTYIAGATTSPFTFFADLSQNGYSYRAEFTNGSGSSTTNAAVLTVHQPPGITAPANIVVSNPMNQCGNTVLYTPIVTGTNPVVTYSFGGATTGNGNGDGSGSVFNTGITTVTLTATNHCGVASGIFSITVNDTQSPAISCPASVTVNCASAVPVPDIGIVSASDNCPGVIITHRGDVITNQTCANRFTVNRKYRATDVAGNFSECTQIITVNDQTAPVITCPASITVTCANAVPAPNTTLVTATDNCAGAVTITHVSDVISNQACANRYTITRTYRATDLCGNFSECAQIITVNDQTPPVITCPASVTVSCANAVPVPNIAVVTATDNCSGVVTITHVSDVISNQTCANRYTILRKYRATDVCGNFAECSQTITVNDQTPPTVICPANMTVTTPAGSCTAVVNFTATAADNCGAVSVTASPASGTAFPVGVSVVNVTAADACGMTASCSFTVTVLDGQMPVIVTQPANRSVCKGEAAVFSVSATNAVGYQWQSWNGTAWVNISGATNAALVLNNPSTDQNATSYRVQVTGLCTTVISAHATLFVNPLPSVTLSAFPASSILPGQRTAITATVNPPGGRMIWYKDGIAIPGAPALVLPDLKVDDQGTYRALYTDLNGCASASADMVIDGVYSERLFVYPNPNMGRFQIRFYNKRNEKVIISVYNSGGEKIYSGELITGNNVYSKIEMDISKMPAGLYCVSAFNSSGERVGTKWVLMNR